MAVLIAAAAVVGWLSSSPPPVNEAEAEQAALDVIAADIAEQQAQEAAQQAQEAAEPDPPAQPPPEPSPEPPAGSQTVGWPWDVLADCESGNWEDGGASFVAGSARWNWGAPGMTIPPWGTSIHHGGLQHHPDTWNWVAPMVGLGHIDYAYQATPAEQVRVATKVQELQGWAAWPVCSRKVGLR